MLVRYSKYKLSNHSTKNFKSTKSNDFLDELLQIKPKQEQNSSSTSSNSVEDGQTKKNNNNCNNNNKFQNNQKTQEFNANNKNQNIDSDDSKNHKYKQISFQRNGLILHFSLKIVIDYNFKYRIFWKMFKDKTLKFPECM